VDGRGNKTYLEIRRGRSHENQHRTSNEGEREGLRSEDGDGRRKSKQAQGVPPSRTSRKEERRETSEVMSAGRSRLGEKGTT